MNPLDIIYTVFVAKFLFVVFRLHIAFNSCIIAVSRYIFIVYDVNVSDFGIEKVRRILILASIVVPLVLSILSEGATPTNFRTMSGQRVNEYIGYCPIPVSYHFKNNQTDGILQSPIYTFAHNYIPSSVVFAIQLFCTVSLALIGSNIMEGVMYLHIYIYSKR